MQGKYFPYMKSDADLERHGVRVFNAIGAMVKACKDEDDATLVKKIHEVGVHTCIVHNVSNISLLSIHASSNCLHVPLGGCSLLGDDKLLINQFSKRR